MRPLNDLLVVDFSTLLPGPMATLLLAEAGARVVKIEPLAGEAMRSYPPLWGADSAIFAMLNRGKESLALDLKTPHDLEWVRDLVMRADVLVEQFRPGVMARLGLGYAELSALNPRLIYCSITGYGQTGPRSHEAGHDLNFIADTGVLALSMGDATAPVQPAAPIGDIAGGSYPAVINVLLALEERRHTGRGRHIDIAMSENLFAMTYWALATGFATDAWPGNGTDLVTGASPRYRVYPTRDRKGLVVAALEPKFWSVFCDLLRLDASFRDDFDRPRKDDGRDCTHCRRRGFRVLGETLCRRGLLLLVRVRAVARRERSAFYRAWRLCTQPRQRARRHHAGAAGSDRRGISSSGRCRRQGACAWFDKECLIFGLPE